jgi:hypothetical protein
MAVATINAAFFVLIHPTSAGLPLCFFDFSHPRKLASACREFDACRSPDSTKRLPQILVPDVIFRGTNLSNFPAIRFLGIWSGHIIKF